MGFGFIFGVAGHNIDEGPVTQTRVGGLYINNDVNQTQGQGECAFRIKGASGNGLKFSQNYIDAVDASWQPTVVHFNYGRGVGVDAPSFTATSSRERKENIKIYNGSALDLIEQTNIVSFNYKNDPEHLDYVGFISEDTPTPLSTEDHKHMSVNSCIGILLKAVQELNMKIEELKNE